MAELEQRHIDWASAQTEGATLTVELTGASAKPWKAKFRSVLALLDTPHSSWGEVRLTKHAIEVEDVQPGSESDLRHFLESVVLQANSEAEPQTQDHDTAEETEGGEPSADEQMTAAFRAFSDGNSYGRVARLRASRPLGQRRGDLAERGPATLTERRS